MSMSASIRELSLQEMKVGDEFSFEETISVQLIDGFAELSGDISPLHMDAGFARQRGFKERVAHGVLSLSFFSRMVGCYFPGKQAVIHSINTRFVNPVYAGDRVEFKAVVDQISLDNRVVVLKVTALNCESGLVHVRGKIQVGFTEEGPNVHA